MGFFHGCAVRGGGGGGRRGLTAGVAGKRGKRGRCPSGILRREFCGGVAGPPSIRNYVR